jgi:hypothetical protein
LEIVRNSWLSESTTCLRPAEVGVYKTMYKKILISPFFISWKWSSKPSHTLVLSFLRDEKINCKETDGVRRRGNKYEEAHAFPLVVFFSSNFYPS